MSKGKNTDLYLMLIPGIVVTMIFCYIPMSGLVMAFQDFNIFKGLADSPFVGFKHFSKLFGQEDFLRVFRNTLILSLYRLIIGFPMPILISLMLNEVSHVWHKRAVQTIIYLPHFLSWVIVYGLFTALFSSSGALMQFFFAGREVPVLLTSERAFRSILVGVSVWKEAGWGTIVYLAAITAINPELYEAAIIDGAGRFGRIWHITLPGIAPVMTMIFIINMGGLLNSQTEQVLMFYNPVVYQVGDVIGTYVYRMGLSKMEYSLSTAVGLFESLIGLVLMISANTLSRRLVQRSIW